MKLQILGCAGGIGGRDPHTTCLRIDQDILLDAGTGLSKLDLSQLLQIDHVFLSHSHLDHVAGLVLLLDAVVGKRQAPVTVYGSARVIETLQEHLFNWALWPDFNQIPSLDQPILRYRSVADGESLQLGQRVITCQSVRHIEGSLAFLLSSAKAGFAFTGDLASSPVFWQKLQQNHKIHSVIVDCSFVNAEIELARRSMHFCPADLLADIAGLPEHFEFLIYHLKPGQESQIMTELQQGQADLGLRHKLSALHSGMEFEF